MSLAYAISIFLCDVLIWVSGSLQRMALRFLGMREKKENFSCERDITFMIAIDWIVKFYIRSSTKVGSFIVAKIRIGI